LNYKIQNHVNEGGCVLEECGLQTSHHLKTWSTRFVVGWRDLVFIIFLRCILSRLNEQFSVFFLSLILMLPSPEKNTARLATSSFHRWSILNNIYIYIYIYALNIADLNLLDRSSYIIHSFFKCDNFHYHMKCDIFAPYVFVRFRLGAEESFLKPNACLWFKRK
jgi:hypothetical protein